MRPPVHLLVGYLLNDHLQKGRHMDHSLVAIFGTFIPISAILVIPIVVWLVLGHAARRQEQVQKTLRAMIQSGQQLSPELIDKVTADSGTGPTNRREKDLRWGVLLVALGIGIAFYGYLDNGFGPRVRVDQVMQMLGVGLVFLLVGLARLGLWRYGQRTQPPPRD